MEIDMAGEKVEGYLEEQWRLMRTEELRQVDHSTPPNKVHTPHAMVMGSVIC